jgi:hypothetical protein
MKRLPSAVLTLILLYAIVVALQFFVGADSLWALLLAPFIVIRSVYWRVGLNRLVFIVLLAGVPILLRRRTRIYLERLLHRFRQWLGRVWAVIVRLWKHLPVWLKTFLGLGVVIVAVAVAMFSGLVLWLVAVVPFLAKTTLGLIVVRWLAHTAAARGLYEIAPVLWNAIPRPFRDWATRRYRHLWWWTMRRIVRNRRRVLRRLRQRERRAAAG